MITPRRTRLVRAADVHGFRDATALLALAADPAPAHARLVVVPTRSAARQLQRSLADRLGTTLSATALPRLATRDELYDRLHAALPDPPRRLTEYEREAIVRRAAREAVEAGRRPSFHLRPGLFAEMLRFYDQLRRQARTLTRFEQLIGEALARDAEYDRGAERMLQQTRLLGATLHGYERHVAGSGACDEHSLRERLIADPSPDPVRAIVVTVGDWIAEPAGLYLADFDLLTRLPGLEAVDVVVTDGLLASGLHERIREWLPDIEEVDAPALGIGPGPRPRILVPGGGAAASWFTARDREDELIAIAQRVTRRARAHAAAPAAALERRAIVYKQPLPYLYLAREVFRRADLPFQTADTLPLAAEPFAAALDLVFECVAAAFTRDTLIALLRSPHLIFHHDGQPIEASSVAALDRALSEARYLGELDQLESLAAAWRAPDAQPAARPALGAAIAAARLLAPLRAAAPASRQLRLVTSFLGAHVRPLAEGDPFAPREQRARAAVLGAVEALAAAHAAYDDEPSDIDGIVADVRRWIEEQTFAFAADDHGVQLVDDQAARYGDFDELAIVGLVEGEWPERPRRNIFYPPSVLHALGWPPEKDRRGAAETRFVELLASARARVAVSTFTLDDEALVEPSTLLDSIRRARLSTIEDERASLDEARVDAPVRSGPWAELRRERTPPDRAAFHGQAGAQPPRTWSVSALETYLGCPFKFFAQHILRLAEEPDDEEVMGPRKQGEFVHEVLETFFETWQRGGGGAITPQNLDDARQAFAEVSEQHLAELSETEAALERTRLLGSPAAAGLGEAVLRMEAERPVPVVDRLLEHRLEGPFTIETTDGPRVLSLRGKADRVDLLADGTFRLIDYKLGWPPNRARALQLPIYGLCAEQRLDGVRARRWSLGEAVYIAFGGPRRVVPLFASTSDRAAVLADAQERLVSTVDAIARGEFPPRPDDVHRCLSCSYASVCRKDYVEDV